jgi:hypothetical protein
VGSMMTALTTRPRVVSYCSVVLWCDVVWCVQFFRLQWKALLPAAAMEMITDGGAQFLNVLLQQQQSSLAA